MSNTTGGKPLPEAARKLLREYVAIIDVILESENINEERFAAELARLEEIERSLERKFDITFSEEPEDD